ncbi:hypothetical protein E8E12_004028 [Didymella heteroderae]|uniref:Uncharacterized protein n=1 Tax=Didymella heteroderae TaxID=1769908 RepID=A0A9P4WPG3_9PLEO|nr:hypothetical protein E8E12_004028 [Didymella heteroderae]
MPPKNTTNSTEGGATEDGKFVWEGANDNKLLLLTQGRYVKPEEYEQLASAFPSATVGSIRNRISALRVKQRNMYEERGWQLPEGGAGHSAKKAKAATSKRAAGDELGGEPATPTKKSRAHRKKKETKSTSPAEADEEMEEV